MEQNQFYFVYGLDSNGELVSEKRVTDAQHLETCAKYLRHDYAPYKICYNKASMCFDGYLVQGEYMGTIKG